MKQISIILQSGATHLLKLTVAVGCWQTCLLLLLTAACSRNAFYDRSKYILCFLLLPFFIFSQSFDIRKVTWGISPAKVIQSELPLYPSLQKDSFALKVDDTNKIITFTNLSIENHQASISYYFHNEQLIAVGYILYNDSQELNLFGKIVRFQHIFNSLIQDKKMKPLYCWTYDNGSYKQFAGKTDCVFSDSEVASNLEKYASDYTYITKALYVLQNERTMASFEFDLKNNNPKILGWLTFQPTSSVKEKLKSKDF